MGLRGCHRRRLRPVVPGLAVAVTTSQKILFWLVLGGSAITILMLLTGALFTRGMKWWLFLPAAVGMLVAGVLCGLHMWALAVGAAVGSAAGVALTWPGRGRG